MNLRQLSLAVGCVLAMTATSSAADPVAPKLSPAAPSHASTETHCGLCHSGVTEQPHREFARSATAVPKLGHEFCGTCHGGDVPGADGTPPEGADCAKCHVAF